MQNIPSAAVAIIRVQDPLDSFLLLRRAARANDPWSGHFSFPGGRKEEHDVSLLDTCLRETYEETGITLKADAVRGSLPAALAGSRFNSPILVQPYLFHLQARPNLKLEATEIQSHYWLETELFLDPSLHVTAEVIPDSYYPAFPLEDYFLWGFTYRLLKNLLETQEEV